MPSSSVCLCLDSSSVFELFALDSSLEIELSEVESVGAFDRLLTIEIEESCTTEIDLPWVVYESTHNVFLDTAAACHLLFLLI